MAGGDVFSAGLSTLPLRGRVGAPRRGGVIFRDTQRITPTRSFAATPPLKGEVKRDRGGYVAELLKLSCSANTLENHR